MLSKINTINKKDFLNDDEGVLTKKSKIPTINSSLKGIVVDQIKKSPVRKIVNDPSEVEFEFEDRLKKSVKKNLNKLNINYKKEPKNRKIFNVFNNISLKSFLSFYPFCYLILFFLVIRLFFMEQGIFHYLDKQNELNLLVSDIKQIEKENIDMLEEIKLINTSKMYQKKMARELLGVIAPDEYLIIFANEKKN